MPQGVSSCHADASLVLCTLKGQCAAARPTPACCLLRAGSTWWWCSGPGGATKTTAAMGTHRNRAGGATEHNRRGKGHLQRLGRLHASSFAASAGGGEKPELTPTPPTQTQNENLEAGKCDCRIVQPSLSLAPATHARVWQLADKGPGRLRTANLQRKISLRRTTRSKMARGGASGTPYICNVSTTTFRTSQIRASLTRTLEAKPSLKRRREWMMKMCAAAPPSRPMIRPKILYLLPRTRLRRYRSRPHGASA